MSAVICWLVVVAWTYWRFKSLPDNQRLYFITGWLAKVTSAMTLGLLYFSYYGEGDTITYWKDGNIVAAAFLENPGGTLQFFWDENGTSLLTQLNSNAPRSVFFVKLSAVLSLLSGGSYYTMALLMTWISFTGLWYLFSTVAEAFEVHRPAAAIALLYFPSVVFWSSGLIKESMGLASLCALAAAALRWKLYGSWRSSLLLSLPALWIAWNLKYYWIGVMVPVMIATLIAEALVTWKPALRKGDWLVWSAVFVVVFILATHVHPNFYLERFGEVIWNSNREFMAISRPGTAVIYHGLTSEPGSIVLYAPKALVAGLYRPFVWEAFNLLSLIASIENLFLVVLSFSAIPSLIRVWRGPFRLMVLGSICYIVLLAIFLAMSTPNFGTLSRYKVGFLPFLVMMLCAHNPLVKKLTSLFRPKAKSTQ